MSSTRAIPYHDATPEFWAGHRGCLFGGLYDEVLTHSTLDGYVAAELDRSEPTPSVLTVGIYRPMDILSHGALDARDVLGRIIEALDDEFGDPEGPEGEQTPETAGMRAAADALVAAVAADYHPWAHERVAAVEVDLARWAAERHMSAEDSR